MKRDDYLADKDVAGFVHWASHLVRGEWRLEHAWEDKKHGDPFECCTLYGAFGQYRWNCDEFADTMQKFDAYRQSFEDIGVIKTPDQRDRFVDIAQEIVDWGEIRGLRRLDQWRQMQPTGLQTHISNVRNKLDPLSSDTEYLRGFKFMGSGFSKIYSALIPGLPIYDSRVACALACLIGIYCQDKRLCPVPPLLDLGIPPGQGNKGGRCKQSIFYTQQSKYAKANLQFAWLMQGLAANPGDFKNVPESQRVDALQSALFMLGYARLDDDAIVKSR